MESNERSRFQLPKGMSRFSCVASWALAAFMATGCGVNSSDKSQIKVRFPEANTLEAQSKVSAQAVDWSRACFAINVTGAGIPQSLASVCDVPTGVFSGAVPPGGVITLDVPSGSARRLEVFTYMRRSGELCRQFTGGFGTLERERLSRVGEIASFDAIGPTVDLTVQLSSPVGNLISQYSLPGKCSDKPPAFGDGSARIGAGYAKISGSRFIVEGRVNGPTGEAKLTGGRFKVDLSRASK